MKLVAMVKASGEISSIIAPGAGGMYDDGATFGDLTAHHLPDGSDPNTAIDTLLWSGSGWQQRTPRLSQFHYWDNGAWVFDAPAAIKSFSDSIDAAAGATRAKYITISPGQDATYAAKYQQATEFLASTDPDPNDYAWVKMEAEATGMTYHNCATRIVVIGNMWHNFLGPSIEAVRISAKDEIETLTDYQAMKDRHDAAINALNSI